MVSDKNKEEKKTKKTKKRKLAKRQNKSQNNILDNTQEPTLQNMLQDSAVLEDISGIEEYQNQRNIKQHV